MSEIDFSQLKDLLGSTDESGKFKLSKGSKDAGKAILTKLFRDREQKRAQKELEAGLDEKKEAFTTQLKEGKRALSRH